MSNIPLSVHFVRSAQAERTACRRWILDYTRCTTNTAEVTCRNCLAVLNAPQPTKQTTEERHNA